MEINQETQAILEKEIREFNILTLPNSLFVMFNREFNDKFFSKMYELFETQKEFSKFLGIGRQEIYKYHQQIQKDRGKWYPIYFPLRLLKRCINVLDQDFINLTEQTISKIRGKSGLGIQNPKLPIKESIELYRITAHIIADGSASKGKTPYYANTCKELREQFKKDLQVFGSMKIYERKPNTVEIVCFPKVVTDILAHLFDVRFTYPNKVPKLIFDAKPEFKKAFLQALFDDEGSISTQLAIGIHDINIMEEIKSLINSLNIKTSKVLVHKYGYKRDKVYLCIPRSEYILFQKEIGFSHPDKAKRLEFAIRTHNRQQRTRNPKEIEQEIIRILKDKPSRTMDLANSLSFTYQGIRPHLDRMLEEGLIVKKGYKNEIIWVLNNIG